jgi:hypothetical protein
VPADTVPTVKLNATHKRALDSVTLAQLEEFADGKVNEIPRSSRPKEAGGKPLGVIGVEVD